MDKLSFQKAIDSLKNTECNTKEKIVKFDQIQHSLGSLQSHSNFKNFLSSAIQIFLLFCEDNDSNCRISAEEHLHRIIRNAEKNQQIVLVQIDLYHELKKNGNDRSLRICLNLFSHYSHLIKHRRRKVYAQNLLPCLLAIGKRNETLVIESLADFMKSFSKNLLNCLTEGETMKLIELFIDDNLTMECAVKRRCSAQNIISMLEFSSKKEFLMNPIILKIQESLSNSQLTNSLLGSLGLLRLIMPLLISSKCYYQKVLELLETNLNYLKTESNHSIINANLEVLNAFLISANSSLEMKDLLVDSEKMLHNDMLLSKRSMSVLMNLDSLKSSEMEALKTQDNFLQIPSASTSVMSTPYKSTDFSDIEGDSFKSIDFDADISSSPATMKNFLERGAESMSLKSTDSINSFFNTIANNTETVSKFFRKSSTDSPSHQPKIDESVDEKSLDYSISQLKDENTDLPDSQTLPETAEIVMEDSRLDLAVESVDTAILKESTREIYIGTLFDQSIVEYIVRLVVSRFLLTGTPNSLISDQNIRVSIKNLALSVIIGCVTVKSEVLLMKLQKDFTCESMMVENLLSYLVDEDLRLEDEDKKKKESVQDESAATTSEGILTIKDNHFGECTTATFLDYFSPLSNSLDDQGLISLKNRIYEEKSKDREESAKKINRDLCQLLSRSEMSESKAPIMQTTLKMSDDSECQFLSDLLLYSTHTDPVLRGNVYMIVGTFLAGVLKDNVDYQKLVSKNETLQFNNLVELLHKGFRDESHTAVKQTLTAVEGSIKLLMFFMEQNEIIKFLDEILLVFSNKYWLVQCKYCDVIKEIDLKLLREVLGVEYAEIYENQILGQLFELIKDSDFRVRSHVCELLPVIIMNLSRNEKLSVEGNISSFSFVKENLLDYEGFFIDLKDRRNGDKEIELQLTRILYIATNSLMKVNDKNQLFGLIYALKILVKNFSPLQYYQAWKEFNLFNVLLSFVSRNFGIALDVSCQCDMLEVISALIGANGVVLSTSPDYNEFTLHVLRILNIYGHLVSGAKPLIIPKTKSKDIFTSSKELAMINSLGFFTNENFYLKLFLVLKSSYESYRMTINISSELKLKHLLHTALKSLQTILELKVMSTDHVKLVEESVGYLNQLIFFQPEDCIVTTKILLKFLFKRNFVNRKSDLDTISDLTVKGDITAVFEMFENFLTFDPVDVVRENNLESSIKLFDPVVIQGLRLFPKSPAKLQAIVLEMLCQLLEFNVNYMQLDAKKVFVDFVLKQLEYIESGLVIDGHVLAPNIVKFLIYLTKLKDKPIMTTPKIINIIDNMLAATNHAVKECGVEALLVLTSEIFFKKSTVKGEADVHEKELNAQREVIISMMIKLLSNKRIQQSLFWILTKSRSPEAFNFVIDEGEIYLQLIQCLKDQTIIQYCLITSISKNILLETKNFSSVIEFYCDLLEKEPAATTSELVSLIQVQVLAKAEEVYLINHIKLHQQRHEEYDETPLKSFVELHQMFLFKSLKSGDQKSLQIFYKFLQKFPMLFEILKSNLRLDEIIKESSRNATKFNDSIKFLFSAEVGAAKILEIIKSQKNINQLKLREIVYKNLFTLKNDINTWENEELMNFFTDAENLEILMKFSGNILLDSLLEDQEISKLILKKLTLMKIPLKRILYLLENVHEECLIDSLKYVIAESARESKICKTLQLALSKKLHSVRNDVLMGRGNVSSVGFEEFEKVQRNLVELKLKNKFPTFSKSIEDFVIFFKNKNRKDIPKDENLAQLLQTADEIWLLERARSYISDANYITNGTRVAEMLFEIKSESRLVTLMTIEGFNIKFLPYTVSVSFDKMLKSFQFDCVQKNPHLNYMKIPPLLKISILILMKNLEKANDDIIDDLAKVLTIFLKWIRNLYAISLIHVEAKLVEKFIGENLLLSSFREASLKFLKLIVQRLDVNREQSETVLDFIANILAEPQFLTALETSLVDGMINYIYMFLMKTLSNTEYVIRYQHPQLFDEFSIDMGERVDIAKQVIFIAKIQECYQDDVFKTVTISSKVRKAVEKLLRLSRNLLTLSGYYQFTLTPYEILQNYRSGDDLLVKVSEGNFKLKQIPIEYLNDSELLELYIRRINFYGFNQRQEFEEIFMTLLVLVNQWNEMKDTQEQFNIKQLCLQTNVDLILSCFRYPILESGGRDLFFHYPRYDKIKMESIGLKKLHHIQDNLDPKLNIFYHPNLEQVGNGNNLVSCRTFEMNQFSLNYSWQMIESREEVAAAGSVFSRNIDFFREKLGVDFKSAIQLIFDVITQMIDENPILVLPQMVKIVEILDDIEQFKWINKKMLSLYESITAEDTISHQYIAYLLCRSSAVLVPSLSEVQHLISIIIKYLNCNQIFVRNACIHGMLSLFESLCKNNTTMGGMSDEMRLLRSCIINYTNKNGIVFESNISSPKHDKLVWTLNFYVIEMTSKFLAGCDLLADSVISANNVLKRTNDLELFYLILNGLERLLILNPDKRMYREKMEKLGLDLMKIENRLYSIGGLKLLVTCLYIGSMEQLENTEKSNGIVQDEPEIVMQSTEKIEILFTRIRTATCDDAEVYAKVLGQILKDLLPPNEILTKVIKELLIMNQSNCACIATILHQVFRSAIDSSYLVLLQDWLICSLQNFLSYPNNKKSIWFLSLIFLSSTLNQNLLKIFPVLLDENLELNELYRIFLVSSKDFFDKLSDQQKAQFKEAFSNRIRTKTEQTSSTFNLSPNNSATLNNALFQVLLKHL